MILSEVTRLRRFDELNNELVATAACEFRNPLTSLRMAVHLCLEEVVGPLTEKQANLLAAAREDCERLQGIIDSLPDLARLSAGRIEMRKLPLPIANLTAESIAAPRGGAAPREPGLRSVAAGPRSCSRIGSSFGRQARSAHTAAVRGLPPNTHAILMADQHLSYGMVISLMNALRTAGITHLAFSGQGASLRYSIPPPVVSVNLSRPVAEPAWLQNRA